MASDINSVTIIGRLGKDIEVKYMSSGLAIGSMSIANTRSSKKGDVWVDETNWFNATLFGSTAESLSSYLLKGQQVCLNGSLKYEEWDKNGSKQSKVSIIVSSIQLIGSKKEGASAPKSTPPQQDEKVEANPPYSAGGTFEEDIPF